MDSLIFCSLVVTELAGLMDLWKVGQLLNVPLVGNLVRVEVEQEELLDNSEDGFFKVTVTVYVEGAFPRPLGLACFHPVTLGRIRLGRYLAQAYPSSNNRLALVWGPYLLPREARLMPLATSMLDEG